MTVGIVGLGLIGGSFAKAYKEAGWQVFACEKSRSTLDFAQMSGAVGGELTEKTAAQCDLVILALYPEASIAWLERMAGFIRRDAVVVDVCGTKRTVCAACFPLAKRYGFLYAGGHPMAGKQFSGIKYAAGDLYMDATMLLVPGKERIFSGSAGSVSCCTGWGFRPCP